MRLPKQLAACERYIPLWKRAVLPLCFVLTGLLNISLYYLGLAFEENIARSAVFAAGCALYAVLCGLSVLYVFKKRLLSGKTWALLALPLAFFAAYFLLRLSHQGFSGSFLSAAGRFVLFCLPAFFAGICCAAWRREAAVFPLLDKLSFWVLPAVVIYVNGAVFHCNPFNFNRNFGILSYMTFAYAVMPFLLAQIVCFCDKAPVCIPFWHKEVRHPQWIRGAMIFLFWTTIIASGTRGAYFCVIGFCLLLFIAKLCRREDARKRAGAAALAVTGLLAFNVFVYAPAGFNVGRMNTFLEGLLRGEIVTNPGQDEQVDQYLEELIGADGNQQIVNREEDPTGPEGDVSDMNLQIGDRGTLYALAIGEFLKAPVTGMGPGSYMQKYGMYPHNVVLELLCETGLVGTGILLLLVLYAIVRLLVIGRKRPAVTGVLLLFVTLAIQACISGSLWNCPALLCALGYGISASGTEPEETL